jgi:hypothetical protein
VRRGGCRLGPLSLPRRARANFALPSHFPCAWTRTCRSHSRLRPRGLGKCSRLHTEQAQHHHVASREALTFACVRDPLPSPSSLAPKEAKSWHRSRLHQKLITVTHQNFKLHPVLLTSPPQALLLRHSKIAAVVRGEWSPQPRVTQSHSIFNSNKQYILTSKKDHRPTRDSRW